MIFAIIYCAIAAIFGIIFCFYGYRYLKKLFICLGFLIGALFAYILLAPVMSTFLAIIVSLLIGAVCGLLLYYLYVVGIFVTGACFGAVLVLIVCMLFGWNYLSVTALVIMGVASITLGILAVIYKRGLMILATAFTGGSSIAMNAGFLISGITASLTAANLTSRMNAFYIQNSTIITAAALALGVAGTLIQFLITAPGRKSRKK